MGSKGRGSRDKSFADFRGGRPSAQAAGVESGKGSKSILDRNSDDGPPSAGEARRGFESSFGYEDADFGHVQGVVDNVRARGLGVDLDLGVLRAWKKMRGEQLASGGGQSLHGRVLAAIQDAVGDSCTAIMLFSDEQSCLSSREEAEMAVYRENIGPIERLADDIDGAILLTTLKELWSQEKFEHIGVDVDERTKVLALIHTGAHPDDRVVFLDGAQVDAIENMTALKSDVVRRLLKADGLGNVYDRLWFLFEGVTSMSGEFRANRLNNNRRVDGGSALNERVYAHIWTLEHALQYPSILK